MKSRLIVVIVALLGLGFGVYMVLRGGAEVEPAKPLVRPTPIPFERDIAGSGIIEPSSSNIEVATPLSGVIEAVYVEEWEEVKRCAPLFRLEDRELQARLRLHESRLEVAKRRVAEAESTLADKQTKLDLVNRLSDKRAVSQEEVDSRKNAVALATARVQTAQAEVDQQAAEIHVIETDLRRMTVESPIDGEVLQVNVHVGEYASAGEVSEPLIVMGSTSPLHVRVDIDENDAWRFDPRGKAVAVPRGNPEVQIPLEFVYVEPYVIPKKSLTGDTSERVDTRVLQVIYQFQKDGYPVYVGQQVDVSIGPPPDDEETPSGSSVSYELFVRAPVS